ncbi:hypothetical protein [Pararhizobium sp. DWP3-4]|uniref:hypothetical protein n=1 Tax=Pararhizobium sp. DWP3-4 TaxID=2804565 RepID=UPI003CF2EE0E
MIKAELLKPLDGDAEGTIREFDQTDFDTLVALGAIRKASKGGDLRDDSPTVSEYVAAGYKASSYPPRGYASRNTAEEIAAAVAAAKPKKALPVKNKIAPPVANKAAPTDQDSDKLAPTTPAAGTTTSQSEA